MITLKKYIFLSLSAVILLMGACKKEEHNIDVAESLRSVNRLDLASMSLGKVGMISDPDFSDSKGLAATAMAMMNSMKVGTRIGVYSYDTYVTAFIDLSELQDDDISIDVKSKKIKLKLPPVKVSVDGRDPLLHEEHVRVTGLRSSITPGERASLKGKMAAEVGKEILNDPKIEESLKASAERKGREWISTLLSDWGYEASIEFRNN